MSLPALPSTSILGPAVTLAAAARNDEGWTAALQRILAEPQCIRVHYQPIVDLQRGIVRGYEALARFPEAEGVRPRDWFDAAARLGYAGALEAQLTEAALVTRPLLVRDRFMAVNLSPAALLSDEVQAVLRAERSLEQFVVELVDQDDGADPAAVAACLAALRTRGVMVAVDDAGPGERSLERVAALRPHFVKVDGAVIAGIEHDERRAQVIRTLGECAARLDAWVVAEGIETPEQLDALVRLGVPLGQGFALGHPTAAMGELDRELAGRMRRRTLAGVTVERLTTLAERAPAVPVAAGPAVAEQAFAVTPHPEHVILVGPDERPVGLLAGAGLAGGAAPRAPLCLPGTMAVAQAARLAMARPPAERFDPIVLIDARGAYAGVIPIDRIVGVLAR